MHDRLILRKEWTLQQYFFAKKFVISARSRRWRCRKKNNKHNFTKFEKWLIKLQQIVMFGVFALLLEIFGGAHGQKGTQYSTRPLFYALNYEFSVPKAPKIFN